MNLAELRDAVYDATGFPVNDGLVTANFVDGQVNRALSYISNLHPWRWLEATDTTNTATVANQSTYTLPTDFVETRSLSISGAPARLTTIDEFDAQNYAVRRPTPSWPASPSTPTHRSPPRNALPPSKPTWPSRRNRLRRPTPCKPSWSTRASSPRLTWLPSPKRLFP